MRCVLCITTIWDMNKIIIKQAENSEEIRESFAIRKEVFVDEQKIFRDSDVDKNDDKSVYLIAKYNTLIISHQPGLYTK